MKELFPVIADFRVAPKEPVMKKLILLCCLGTAKLTASQDLKLLDAIAQVESGGDAGAIGPCGSRGLYQLSELVWQQHAPKSWPYSAAHNPARAQSVALTHLQWLRKELEKDPEIGVGNVTNHHLASAWLRGVNYRKSVEEERRWLERLEYCARVKALMEAAQ